ncbi:unnamed protein product [Ceratitis capitata]|uniref:(Mediterranean fruit fly) hypothetical protein n=1 Tax=Ceratitis capitata TaxID=7213 RepID=A0A811VBL0_CERCA|nr:unnamed protein product [Ceratitis capitata]
MAGSLKVHSSDDTNLTVTLRPEGKTFNGLREARWAAHLMDTLRYFELGWVKALDLSFSVMIPNHEETLIGLLKRSHIENIEEGEAGLAIKDVRIGGSMSDLDAVGILIVRAKNSKATLAVGSPVTTQICRP